MIRLPNTDKEGANDNVLYAASHSLEPLHVNKKELHTGAWSTWRHTGTIHELISLRENRNLSTLPLGGKAVVGKRELPSLTQLPTKCSFLFIRQAFICSTSSQVDNSPTRREGNWAQRRGALLLVRPAQPGRGRWSSSTTIWTPQTGRDSTATLYQSSAPREALQSHPQTRPHDTHTDAVITMGRIILRSGGFGYVAMEAAVYITKSWHAEWEWWVMHANIPQWAVFNCKQSWVFLSLGQCSVGIF